MVIKEIRVFPSAPLLEVPQLASDIAEQGWFARASDRESITFSRTFEDEGSASRAIDELAKDARIHHMEHGTVAGGQYARDT
jgi:hypothetical protein